MCGNRFQHHVLGYYAQPEHTMAAPFIVCAPADIPPSTVSFTAWLISTGGLSELVLSATAYLVGLCTAHRSCLQLL